MLRRSSLVLLLFVGSACLLAEDGADKGSVMVAYELEINPSLLNSLAGHFDLDNSREGRAFLFKESLYVLNGSAPQLTAETARDINPNLLREMGQPLPLGDLSAPASASRPSSLIGVNGAPLSPRTALDELQQRWERWWNSASMADRVEAVPMRALPPSVQSRILFNALPNRFYTGPNRPPLRQGGGELREVLAPFLWHRDRKEMEFTDKWPSEDVDATLKRWKRLASLANVSGAFNTPRDSSVGAGYHLNISVHGKYERDLETFARLYQVRHTLRRVDAGEADAALDFNGLVGYTSAISLRGAVRLKSPNFFEVRSHWDNAETEVRELIELLKKPPGEAERILADQIQQSLTPSNMSELAKRRRDVLADSISLSLEHASTGSIRIDYTQEAVRKFFQLKQPTPREVLEASVLLLDSAVRHPKLAQMLAETLHNHIDQQNIGDFMGERDIDDTAEFIEKLASLSGKPEKLLRWQADLGALALAEFNARPRVAVLDYLLSQTDPKTTFGLLETMASAFGAKILQNTHFGWDKLSAQLAQLLNHPDLAGNQDLRDRLLSNVALLETNSHFETVRTLLSIRGALPVADQEVLGKRIAKLAEENPRIQALLISHYVDGNLSPQLHETVGTRMSGWKKALDRVFEEFSTNPSRMSALSKALGMTDEARCHFDSLAAPPRSETPNQ